MGRHAAIEIDAPTVQISQVVAVQTRATPGHDLLTWTRTPAWSLRQALMTVAGAHLALTLLSCFLRYPGVIFSVVTVAASALAVSKARSLEPKLFIVLGSTAAACYLVRAAVLTGLTRALGYRAQESLQLSAWLAHPGTVLLGIGVTALLAPRVRSSLQALWVAYRPAAWTPATVAAAAVVTVVSLAAMGPVVSRLTDVGGFSRVVPASSQTVGSSASAATSALGCLLDPDSDLASPTCTRNALIKRVCSLDVSEVSPIGTSSGVTVWTDANANMAKFSTNFTPTAPFTAGGIECVEHRTTSGGYLSATTHTLRIDVADWSALRGSGALSTDLESRIQQA